MSADSQAADRVTIHPSGPLQGAVQAPGDKSISHRALICNALAEGEAQVSGLLDSDDIRSTMACLHQWGVAFERDADRIVVCSPGQAAFRASDRVLDCGNSGTSIRLLAGVAAGLPFRSSFDGDASLRGRPMRRVLDPLQAMGAQVTEDRTAPFQLRGGGLSGFDGPIAVASAQVKSAIVFAALSAASQSRIVEPGPSRDHTERLLSAMGAEINVDGLTVRVEPAAQLRPRDVHVPADISAAAFWMVGAAMTPGAQIVLPNLGVNPRRTGVIDALRLMGAEIVLRNERDSSGEPVADVVVHGRRLRGTALDGDLIVRAIDELPVLAVAAANADGVTEIRDAEELRVKESDRIASIAAMLRAMGIELEERRDGLKIIGGQLRGGSVDSHGDHRVAMAAAIGAMAADSESGPTQIAGASAVDISYPAFWRDLHRLQHDR